MPDIITSLAALRVIPVVTIERTEDVMPLADALVEGGLPCAEITFRTPAAAAAMRMISRREDILLGAGTVLTCDQVSAAMDAGARFVVSPGFNPKVAGECKRRRIAHIPGVCTPTEIEAALDSGLRVLKFFPAEACGGLGMLKAISQPYASARFVPTGGINAGNLAGYLRFSKVLACGGTWIAETTIIRSGRFDIIRDNARAAVNIAAECGPAAALPSHSTADCTP
ncbi:MAG: bifunctional 4-hydroxy-2-oxoglutarate aldolase/2-dehydro-3-deoxy-phosphogluconate aldolase [Pseudomonadota bacterium]